MSPDLSLNATDFLIRALVPFETRLSEQAFQEHPLIQAMGLPNNSGTGG